MSEPTRPGHESGNSRPRRLSTGKPATPDDLLERVSSVVDEARQAIASYANATSTMAYWRVGSLIDSEVLDRAASGYGAQIVVTLSRELVDRYGRNFEEKNLRRMVQFARLFPDPEIVVTLSRQLSWSHFLALLPLRSEEARAFYAAEALTGRWTVRELRAAIQRKSFERREIANSQIPAGVDGAS